MEATVAGCLESIELEELQQFENMAVMPLVGPCSGGPRYMTLSEAMAEALITVTEVSTGGSVPELKAINGADVAVLLLDGEELAGAKQNRVLNTTILLKKNSETIIPVSCTEHGRWSYASGHFADSGVLMSPRARSRKVRAVSASLAQDRAFRSDQGQVWEDVEQLSMDAGVHAQTGAMRDVFSARKKDLDDYLKAFNCSDGQMGLLVFIGGDVVALDIVSRAGAYARLHAKFVKSYAMDALVQARNEKKEPSVEKARAFIQQVQGCEGKRHQSVGHGWDHRFRASGVVGSALVYRKTVVHAAFFRADESEQAGRISSFRHRRGFRL